MDTLHFRFLLGIRSPEPVGATVAQVEQLFRDAHSDDPELDDGHIGSRRRPRGGYQFATVETVRTAFPDASWLTVAHPEPLIGPVRGFLNFDWWTDDIDYKSHGIACWYQRSHGYLVDHTHGATFDSIGQLRWPLAEAFNPHGFSDGDFFLDRPAEYRAAIRLALSRELMLAGVEPTFIDYDTHHNPMLVRSRETEAVADRFVDLWGFDWAILDDPRFRRDVLQASTSTGSGHAADGHTGSIRRRAALPRTHHTAQPATTGNGSVSAQL